MATDKQIAANRSNAQKSCGPRTDAGKQTSSRNSFKLGIHVSDAALFDDPETAADLEHTFSEYLDSLKPINALERDQLEEIAICKVHMRLLVRLGTGLLNDARERAFGETCSPDPNGKPVSRFDRSQYPPEEQRLVANLHLAAGWVRVHDFMEIISRQEARLATRYRHAQNAWLQLLRSRELLAQPDLKNEAISPGPPEPEPARAPEPAPQSAPEPVPSADGPVSSAQPAPETQPAEPRLQNEPNFAQLPVIATPAVANAPAPKLARPGTPRPNQSDNEVA
jgi:hypothetical protein